MQCHKPYYSRSSSKIKPKFHKTSSQSKWNKVSGSISCIAIVEDHSIPRHRFEDNFNLNEGEHCPTEAEKLEVGLPRERWYMYVNTCEKRMIKSMNYLKNHALNCTLWLLAISEVRSTCKGICFNCFCYGKLCSCFKSSDITSIGLLLQ